MNNLLIQSPPNNTPLSQARQVTPSFKLIVFTMSGLNLALRIETVYKVVNHTPVYSSGLSHVGVAHLSEREVTVLDLYWRFFKKSQQNEFHADGYLIIVRTTTDELYGIPVAQTPVLLEVPLTLIRALPESYRCADTLGIASHVAIIPQETEPLTVFLLDVDLIVPNHAEITPFGQNLATIGS